MRPVTVDQMLFSQGFGTRHDCRALALSGRVSLAGRVLADPGEALDPEGAVFAVDGEPWPYFEKAVIALNKPAGYECSARPSFHPSVMSLRPAPLRARGMQPVGRLDEDTTGLLLFTDDGQLQHRLIHPKKHVAKTYRVTARHPVTQATADRLLAGVLLADENETVRAESCAVTGARELVMTITSGKYHQVKRMIAAAGNRVEALHRTAVGFFELPAGLAPGRWQWIADPAVFFRRPA